MRRLVALKWSSCRCAIVEDQKLTDAREIDSTILPTQFDAASTVTPSSSHPFLQVSPGNTFFLSHDTQMWLEYVAWVCLAWYAFITLVCTIGYTQLYAPIRGGRDWILTNF